jgi:hypothetical protein
LKPSVPDPTIILFYSILRITLEEIRKINCVRAQKIMSTDQIQSGDAHEAQHLLKIRQESG